MNWHLSAKASSLYIEFLQDGEFVVPDAGSIFLTIRDNAGAVLSGYDSLALADTALSTMTYTVPQAVNEIGAVLFETRYVRVDFKVGLRPLVAEQVYRIGPFIPLAATTAEVRGLFGAREQELPDSDIDLRGAYYLLLDEYPGAMTGALTASTTAWLANRAVILMAGIQVAPSMPSRALKEEGLNNATQIRATIDWVALQQQIVAELGVTLGKLEEAAGASTGAALQPIIGLSLPVDPVTNA